MSIVRIRTNEAHDGWIESHIHGYRLVQQHDCSPVSIQQCDIQEMRVPKSSASEAQQVVEFFSRVSERLKSQNRHFDDAVANHCIRLICEHANSSKSDAINAIPLLGAERG